MSSADELTKTLLVEEVTSPRKIADALFASVTGNVPLLQAIVDTGATTHEVLGRYLARHEAPFQKQIAPHPELVDRLPPGLCARLLAIPVRHDAVTGTVDLAVADPSDPHPANEVAHHLKMPVRVVRAPLAAIEQAIRHVRLRDRPADRFREAAMHAEIERTPRAPAVRAGTLPPPEPALAGSMPSHRDLPPRRGGLVIDTDSAPPEPMPAAPTRIRTPPWGTPVQFAHRTQDAPQASLQKAQTRPPTEPPRSGYGSEIPIPLTRRTFHPAAPSGTQRPAMMKPGLGDGYDFDTTGFRDVVERARSERPRPSWTGDMAFPAPPPLGSFIPKAPAVPNMPVPQAVPQLPFPDMSGVLAALRNAGTRDQILEVVLAGARIVALKVALFVVKKGGYLGWVGTPEIAEKTALQTVLVPLEADSIFDRAVREDIYLGPIRYDDVHAPLLRVLKNPSRDVAAVPIRVSGKTAVIILADELGDTMIATRRLEELARAAGDAFGRIVRHRQR